jgi:hypothetical protein
VSLLAFAKYGLVFWALTKRRRCFAMGMRILTEKILPPYGGHRKGNPATLDSQDSFGYAETVRLAVWEGVSIISWIYS